MTDFGDTNVISPTDASNASGTHPSFSGSAAPSTLDDASRALQGAAARDWAFRNFTITTGGTSTAYTATYTVAPAAYRQGQEFGVIIDQACGASPTFKVGGLAALTCKKQVAGALVDIEANDWLATDRIKLAYNSTGPVFVWTNPVAAVAAASTTVAGKAELLTTTELLTGTDTTRAATADSIAALWEAGANITDGAAITIGEGGYFNLITSTTAITSFSITTDKAGRSFRVRFDTARTLTHNATSLILPGGANITTAQGDIAFVRSLGSGNVVVEAYTKASGAPVVSGNRLSLASDVTNSTTSFADITALSFAVTSGVKYKFKFFVVFTVPAVATGSGWSINGPGTPTHLAFDAPLGVAVAYDTPTTTTSSSSFAADNRIVIEGVIQPATTGTVIGRFKSETSGQAVVAKAGVSYVEWEVIG